jgi:hypothetical protein
MQLMHIFEVLLLAACVAGIFIPWDRRSSKDRRKSERGGRRTADGAQADTTEPTCN